MTKLSDAIHLMRMEKYKEAIKAFEEIYQETGNIVAKTSIAAIYCLQKEYNLARAILESLPQGASKTYRLLGWAFYHHHLGELFEESKCLNQIPNTISAFIDVFHYFIRTKQKERAALQLNKIKAHPDARKSIIEELGSMVISSFSYPQALALIRTSIADHGDLNIDRIFASLKTCITKLHTLPPEEYKTRQEIVACIKDFALAYPDDPSPLLIEALLFEREGELNKKLESHYNSKAEIIYKKALAAYPNSFIVVSKAARFISKKLTEHDEAEDILLSYLDKCIKQKIEISPRSEASIYNSLAINADNSEQAAMLKSKIKAYAKKAVEADDTFAVAHATLGHCYQGLGQKEKAAVEFNRAFELDHDRFQRNHGNFAELFQSIDKIPQDELPPPWLERKKRKEKRSLMSQMLMVL